MMTQFLLIEDGGYAWHVPLQFIAEHRADHYADDPDTTRDEEIEYILFDDCEGIDWFQNNMDWADVKAVAVLVQTPEPKEEPDMSDADVSIVTVSA